MDFVLNFLILACFVSLYVTLPEKKKFTGLLLMNAILFTNHVTGHGFDKVSVQLLLTLFVVSALFIGIRATRTINREYVATIRILLHNALLIAGPLVILDEIVGIFPALAIGFCGAYASSVLTRKKTDRVASTCIDLLKNHKNMDNIAYAQDRGSGAAAFVHRRDGVQYIVFPGSDSQIDFLRTNANTRHVKPSIVVSSCHGEVDLDIETSRIHGGFQEAYATIRDKLRNLVSPSEKTIVCGHSLGGALAILYAMESCAENTSVYTFGAPRVGNGAWNDSVEKIPVEFTHFVTGTDPVPMLPATFPRNSGEYVRLPSKNPIQSHFLSEYENGVASRK